MRYRNLHGTDLNLSELGFGKRSDFGVVALHVTLGVRLDALASSRPARTASR